MKQGTKKNPDAPYWFEVVWNPLGKPNPEPLRIQKPAKPLDHVKREVVAARCFDIPVDTIAGAAERQRDS